MKKRKIVLPIIGTVLIIFLIIGIFEFSLNPILKTKLWEFFRWPYKEKTEVSLRQFGTSAIYVLKAIILIIIFFTYFIGACAMVTYPLVKHPVLPKKEKS